MIEIARQMIRNWFVIAIFFGFIFALTDPFRGILMMELAFVGVLATIMIRQNWEDDLLIEEDQDDE